MYITLGDTFVISYHRWKLFSLLFLTGALVTIFIASSLTRKFDSDVELLAVSTGVAEIINNRRHRLLKDETETEAETLSPSDILETVHEYATADITLLAFIKEQGYFDDASLSSGEREIQISGFINSISFISQYEETGVEGIRNLQSFNIALNWPDEEFAVQFLNGYLKYLQKFVTTVFNQEADRLLTARVEKIEDEIASLRQKAKENRLFEISKKEFENADRIRVLESELKLTLAAYDREKNTKLANIAEAYGIAKQLQIDSPTPLSSFNQGPPEVVTNIRLTPDTEQQNEEALPLYLMGTKYLAALREALEERKDDSVYLDKINQILDSIASLQEDTELKNLKNRETDDPFIPRLPNLLAELSSLELDKVSFDDVEQFRITKFARVTGIPAFPNTKLILIAGILVSFILAFSITIMIHVFQQDRKKTETEAG